MGTRGLIIVAVVNVLVLVSVWSDLRTSWVAATIGAAAAMSLALLVVRFVLKGLDRPATSGEVD